MRVLTAILLLCAAVLTGACDHVAGRSNGDVPSNTGASVDAAEHDGAEPDSGGVTIRIAPGVQGRVDEALIREAYERAAAQGEADFGIRPERPVVIYIDPDSAIGLEDALGLSSRYAIHLRAGRAQRMDTLMPLMMHEYMHVLQYSVGRLRPQWWIEGQAEHQAQRVIEPARADRNRRSLLSSLASDVRNGNAPSLASLRGSTGWDEYIRRSGAGRAYGWGQAAVTFIEDGWGFDAVKRIVTDREGPNTVSSFDEAVRRETGMNPAEFEQHLHDWLLQRG
jgi:hypothetical protein